MEIEFTSWRQPKFARTLDQSRQEGDEIERGHKKIHGADERQESLWSESLKASQKREDELATQTADSLAVTKKVTGRKKNLELPSTPGFGCVMKPR